MYSHTLTTFKHLQYKHLMYNSSSHYSKTFDLGGGVIQGGKGSPVLWILGLACLLRKCDIARFPMAGRGETNENLDGERCAPTAVSAI